VRPSVKYRIIYRHKDKYPIQFMCTFFGVSRSGYYNFAKRMDLSDKDEAIAKQIVVCQEQTNKTYG